MNTKFWVALAVVTVVLALGTPTKANDTIQITCTGSTSCTDVIGILNTNSSQPDTFSVKNTNNKVTGDAFLAIIEPVTSGANFTSGTLWLALNDLGGTDHNLSSTQSFSPSTGGYFVQDIFIGEYTGGTPINVSLGGLPSGTLIVSFLEDENGNVISNSPWSESLLVLSGGPPGPPVVIPEPGTLVLFGSGLLGLAGVVRRRLGV
jgi:hypothetical protein